MKFLVVGTGRMGHAVAQAATARGHQLVMLGRADNIEGAGLTADRVAGIDAAIEFTVPASAPGNLTRLIDLGVPTVTGTTGWLEELTPITRHVHAHRGALLHATNFSVGVHLFLRSARMLATLMRGRDDFEAEVTETHHARKLDAPSGTAISLTTALSEGDPSRHVPITSIRRGDVIGEHEVRFTGPFDSITLAHEALDRTAFAIGAVMAAEWLPGRTGVFTFDAMLFGETA